MAVRGWVATTRSSGKIAFVVVRDGTGMLQTVLSKKEVSADVWDALGKLTHETSVEVSGVVRADARAPGGVELQATDLRIIGPSSDFPITPKEHRTAFLFEHRHLFVKRRLSRAEKKVLKRLVRSQPQLRALREIMDEIRALIEWKQP